MLAQMIQQEVDDWLAPNGRAFKMSRDAAKWFANGFLPKRKITTGVGQVEVQQPSSARSTAGGSGRAFHVEDFAAVSAKDQEHRGVDPVAVLEGRQHGRLQRSPKGPGGAGLSRLVGHDRHPIEGRMGRRIPGVEQTILGGQGVTCTCGRTACIFNIRLEEDRQCILVLMGATADGRKELIAVVDGFERANNPGKGCSWT